MLGRGTLWDVGGMTFDSKGVMFSGRDIGSELWCRANHLSIGYERETDCSLLHMRPLLRITQDHSPLSGLTIKRDYDHQANTRSLIYMHCP